MEGGCLSCLGPYPRKATGKTQATKTGGQCTPERSTGAVGEEVVSMRREVHLQVPRSRFFVSEGMRGLALDYSVTSHVGLILSLISFSFLAPNPFKLEATHL
jgi:hypothetical protein